MSLRALNDGLPVAVIFRDMSKAFDFVDPNLLFYKLVQYGNRGKANDCIRDYLSDRKQYVEISKIQNNKKRYIVLSAKQECHRALR